MRFWSNLHRVRSKPILKACLTHVLITGEHVSIKQNYNKQIYIHVAFLFQLMCCVFVFVVACRRAPNVICVSALFIIDCPFVFHKRLFDMR